MKRVKLSCENLNFEMLLAVRESKNVMEIYFLILNIFFLFIPIKVIGDMVTSFGSFTIIEVVGC